MAHRGRLNVLVNILGKPPQKLFDEFEGKFEHPDDPAHSGDVKYHMGFSADVKTPKGGVHVALAFNPSHLEIVNPVVAGSVHARQTRRRDSAHRQSMAVLIHGDAAFAGQGVNMELLNMSQARGFRIGGSAAHRGQQPGRLHHLQSAGRPLHDVLHRPGQDGQRAGAARQRRRPGSGDRGRPAWRIAFRKTVPARRGDRSGLLPPPRPQRGRRTGRHATGDVPDHSRAPDDARSVSATTGQAGRARRRRGAEAVRGLSRPAGSRQADDRYRPGTEPRRPRSTGHGSSPANCRRRPTPVCRKRSCSELAAQHPHHSRGHTLHPRVAKIYEDRRKMAGRRTAGRLGLCRKPGLRHADRRRPRHAPGRPGHRSRHLLPPPRRAA